MTVVLAGVLGTFNDAASKEALAALAAQYIVMEAGGLVATNTAHLISEHFRSGTLLSLHWLSICTHIKEWIKHMKPAGTTSASLMVMQLCDPLFGVVCPPSWLGGPHTSVMNAEVYLVTHFCYPSERKSFVIY